MVAIVSGNSLGLSLSSLATLGQSAVTGTATQGRNGEGAYVNAATGNLVLQDTDLTQPERGNQSIDSVRTYNSLGSTGADNWTKGFDLQSLALTAGTVNAAGSIVTRTDSDGAKAAYAYNATTGLYVATNGGGAFDTIAYNATTHVYTRTDGSTQMVESYTSAGVLTSLTDSDGNVVTVTHNAAGLVSSVMDPAGATRTYYDYDTNNRLTQIHTVDTASLNSTWVRYAYDTSGRLTTVTVDLSPADNAVADNNTYVTTYSYVGATADIASVTQKDGTSLTFTYDASLRVASVTDQLGNKTTFAYDTTNRNTTVTDPNNAATVYHYDTLGQLASVTAPTTGTSTATTSYTYNANGDVTQVTDGAGRTVTMAYDANGNQTQQQDAAGNTVTRVYDALNHLVTETAYVVPDPDGAGAGTASVPMTTRYVYDPAGQHLLRFVLTPEGRVTEYRYDAVGNRTSTIQYGSAVYALTGMATTAAPTLAQMTAWTPTLDLTRTTRTDVAYDVWGQPTASTAWTKIDATGAGVVDGTQSVTHYTYSQFGRLLNTISPLAGSTSYTYDGLGRVLTSVNAAGVTTTTTYDDVHNKTTVTYANGLVVTSTYDQAGRLMSVTQGTSTTPNLGTTQYAYDADGNQRMVTDPDGIKHYMLYDAGGRKIADIDANGSMVESVYNNADQVVETIRYANAMSAAVLATLVDANGKPTAVAIATLRPSGQANTSWTLYDAAGRVSRQVDAMGYVTETRYDGASRVTDVIRYATATATVITPASLPTDIVVTANAALDRHTRALYDNDGRVVGSLNGTGNLTENVYDALGNLVHTIAYATVSPSAYWATGTLAQLRPAADATHDIHAWNYYDDQNRLVGALDGEGYLTEYGYDADGNQTRTLRYATKALVAPTAITANTTLAQLRPATGALDHTTTAAYNTLDQVVSRTDEYGTITQYTYDNVGHLLSTVSAAGGSDARTVTETYDVQGRVTGVLNGRGSAALAALGQPAAPSAVASIWATYGTTYTYDADGLRTSMTDGAGNKTLYFYDADGHQTFAVDALGDVTETRYNALNLVSATIRYAKTLSVAGLTGGPDSQVSALVAAIHSGTADYSVGYSYDARNELNRQVDALAYVTTKAYDAFGDVVSTTQGLVGGATENSTTTYDRRGLVTANVNDTVAVTGIAATTTIVRDAFGRVTSLTDADGNTTTTTYDRLGRAVQATDGMTVGKATTYTSYDAFGRTLTSKDGNGYTTTYTWNDASLTMVMSGPASTSVTTTYDRHGETISVRNEDGVATTTQYDLDGDVAHTIVDSDSGGLALDTRTDYDTAGRIADTVDANGVKTAYAYDAANRVLTRTVDPGGLSLVTRFTYDGMNDVLTQTDPDGIVTKMTYDAKGEVLTRTVDPTGSGARLNLTSTFTYDSRGNTLTTTDPAGTVTTYTYDHLGRRISMVVDSAAGGLNLRTNYAYDRAGNLTQVLDPRGAATRYIYDADNRLQYTLDNEGGLTETDYDADGHVTKQVVYATRQAPMMTTQSPSGVIRNVMLVGGIVTSAADQVTQTTYDANGRKTLVQVDPSGLNLKTQYAYDNAGNLTRVIDPDGNVTRTQYDKANRAIYVLDPANTLTQNVYDKNGRVLTTATYAVPPTIVNTVVAANGAVTNTFGGVTFTPATDQVTQRTYDAAGRQLTSSQTLAGTTLLTTRYEYDANGNVTRMTDPAGNITRYVYDDAGRLRYKLDALYRLTETDYDSAGRIVASIVYGDAQMGINTSQAANGLVTNAFVSITPDTALDRVTRYAYDTAGRLVYTVDPVGNVTENQYDASGNLAVQRHYVTPMDLPTAGSTDGKTVTVAGTTAEVTGASYVAINPAHSYTLTVRARQLSGTGLFYAGVITKDASGNVLSNSVAAGGTYAYCAASGVTLTPEMGWQTFSGTITGSYTPAANTTNTGSQFFAGSASAAPLLLYNYGSSANADPGRDVEIDSVTLYDNTTGTTVNVDPALVNGSSSLAMVSGSFDAAASSPYATLTLAQVKSRLRASAGDQITRCAYDGDNRQVYAVDANGVTTKIAYDGAGNVSARTTFGTPIDLPTAGSTDGKTVTVAGTTAEVTGASYVAINPAHSYTLTVRARQLSGTGLFYAGVITKDASGNVLSNSLAAGGTYAYCAASGVTLTPEMGWQTFSGTITGSYTPAANTTNTGSQFFTGSASAAPLLLYNYGSSANADPGRDVEIDSVTLYDNTTGTTVNVDPALVNGNSSLAMVSGSFETAPSTVDAALSAAQISARLRVNPATDRTTRYAYDAAGRAVLTVDPTGQVTETTYDNDGNVSATRAYATPIALPTDYSTALDATTIRAALSASATSDRITRTVYDADARVIYTVGAQGLVTSYVYDDFGNVASQTTYGTPIDTSTLGIAIIATDVTSRLTVQAAIDRTTRNVHDALGRLVLSVDPVGQATLTSYDADGHVSVTRQLAKAAPIGSAGGTDAQLLATVTAAADDTRDRTTRDFYDADGRQVYEVDGRGYVTETRYFTNHTQTIRYVTAPPLGATPTTATIATALAGIGSQTTDQYYDADGNATDHIDASGVTSRNVYDGLGRVVTHIDALGKAEQTTTGYTYDVAGRVLTQTTAQGTAAAATTVNTYDAFGELLTQVSPQGYALANVDTAWTQATRPKLGYPVAAASLTAAQKAALLALYTSSHAYDLDGRETRTTNAAGATTTTTYDAFGDAVAVVDPLGNTGYFYFDALGRVTLQVDPAGIATETLYTPGFTDKVASVRRYALTVAAGTYSATTRPVLTKNAQDGVTSYTYDADGRVRATTDGAGTESIVYQASANGSMDLFDKVVTNKVGGAATYLYDQSGDEASETLPVTSGGIAVSNTYVYDAFGNRVQSIEGVNLATNTALPEARTTQYRYDAMGRVIYRIGTAYTAADGTTVTPVDSSSYDALGRVIETRTNASWNGSAATGGVRTLNYYDAAGNTVMTIAADGAVVGQTFTPTGKVFKSSAYATPIATATFNALVAGGTPPTVTVDSSNDRVTTSVYDTLDRVVETDLDNVVHWEQNADPTAPVILTLAGAQSGPEPMSMAVYDANGNVVQQIDGRGNSTYNYYDAAGRKTLSIDAGGFATAWDYNSVGGSAVANAFDTPIRQVQYSTALSAGAYARQGDTSVANANLRTPAALRATLDAIVAAAGNPNRVTTYTLDNAGRVTQKAIASVVYSTVAQGSGSTFTTSSGTAASVTTTTYDGLGDILSQQQGAGDATTYVYDALGRVVEQRDASFTGIVDTSGTAGSVTPVTDTEYDALGNVHRTIQRGTNGASEADDRITLSVYDANGNLTQQTDANGNVTKYAYDALGRVARSTVLGVLDASGGHTDEAKTYTYDAMGRQVTQTDVGTGQIQFTKYDAFGEIVNKGMGSVASGTTPVYQEYTQYNVMGKVQRSNTGDGVSKIYLYDKNGNTTRQITSTSVDLTGVSIIASATNTALQHTFSVYDSRNNLVRTVEPDISYQQDQVSSQAAYSEQLTNLYGAISVGNSAGGTYTAGSVDPNGYGYTQVGGESGSSAMPGASTAGVWNTSAPSPTPSTSAAAMATVYAFPLTWGGGGKFDSGFILPATWSAALNYRIIRTDNGAVLSTPVPGGAGAIAASPAGVYMQLQASSGDMGWTTVATLYNSYTPGNKEESAFANWGSTVVLPYIVSGLAGVSVDAYTNFGTPSQANSSLTALGSSEYNVTNPGSPVTLIWHDASGIRMAAVATWPGGVLSLSPLPQAQVWTPANQRMPNFSSSVIATSGSTTLYYRIIGSKSDWSNPPVTLSGNVADLTGLAANQNYEYILSSNRGEFYGTLTTGGAGQMSLPQTQMSGVTAPPGFAMLSQPLVGYNPQIAFDVAGTLASVNVAPPGGYVMDLNLNGTTVEVPLSGTSANFDPHSFGINLSRYVHTGVSYYYNVFAVQAGGARQFVGQGSGTMTLGGSDFTQQNYGSGTYQPTAFLTLPSSTALTGTLNVGGIAIGVNSGDWRIHRTTDSASNPVLAIDLSQFLSQNGVSISYSAGDAVFSGSYNVASNGAVTCNGVSSQVRQPLVPISIAGAAALSVLRVGPIGGPLVDVPTTLVSTSGSTFTWDASAQAGQGIKQFYYEARNAGGTLVGMGYGTMTLAANGTLTYSMDTPLLKPSAMTFTPPVTATTFTLNIRPHGSTGAYTTTVYSNLTPGQTVTYDATGLRPGSGSNVYDYVYLGTDAGGNKVSSGTGTVTVNADGTTNTTIVSDRAPLVLQGPAGEHVPRMEIDLAPHSSGTTPTKIFLTGTWNATLNCSVFSWDVSAWQPNNGSQAAYDYTMTMQNADGSAFKNEIGNPISITGVMTLGASGSSAVSIQQYVNELNVAAQVSHNQTFDAFGEISSEYDDATLQRAQADVALYGGTLDSSAVRTTFLYNTMGELIQKMDPQTSITLANGFRYRAQPVTTYAYDLDGRLTVTTDANGNKTEQNYAGGGDRAHSQWAGDGGEKTTDYDTFGSVAKLTDELGFVTLQKVDKMGNLVEADQLGISRIANASSGPNMVAATLVDTYTYDAFGHRITHANASTAVDKTYYDSLGRVTKTVTDAGRATTYGYTFVPFGAGPGILGNGGVSIGGYQLRTTNADSSFTLDNINYFGVTTWHQDEGGHTFEYDYDVGGHLTHQFSSSSGQNIYYTYYANGDIKQSSDLADHTLTRYGYDNAGNRTWEQYSALNADNVTPGAIFQSSTISYDELNRMMHVSDPSTDVQYQYDAVGNRRSVQATYFDPLQGLRQQDNFWYTYDAANRFLITKGSLAGHASSAGDTSASIVQGTQGVIITYDQRGERKSARNADGSQEAYTYTADGYLQDTTINGTLRARRRVDALGRTFEYLEYDTSGVTTTTDQTSLYDADSRLLSQTDVKANSVTNYFYFTDTTDNQATAIQTGAGVLAHVDTTPQTGVGTSTIYSYVYWDSAKETGIQVKALGAGTASWASGFSQLQYDDNGYLTAASDIADNRNYAYVNSANGLVLRREETGSAGHFFDYWYYASDRMIGDVSTNAAENAAGRTSYAEELAQSTPGGKVDPTSFKHTAPATSQVATADFDQNYQPINSTYPAATGSTYTVRNGDTLKSIARQVWGDADMWYLIAQANNLGGNETLVAGQVLQIPNKVTNIHNNANTFRPYNPGEVIGHIDPSLPQPPAPAAKSGGGGCGTIGTIIMVVVAVVVTIYTCGAAAELLAAAGTAAAGTTGFAATMALGGSVLAGTAGAAVGVGLAGTAVALGAAAIGGAIGSIASQAVGDAMGNTHGFSWKQVATAAIGSAVTAGVGEAFAPAANAVSAQAATELNTTGAVSFGTSAEQAGLGVAQAVTSSAVGQLLKGEWSWRQIAASAVSSAAGQAAGAAMSSAVGAVTTDVATQAFAQKLGSNLGGAWASQQVLATDPRYTKARTSSLFANALGQAIGDTISDTVIKQGQVDQAAAASQAAREANRFGNAVGSSYANASMPSMPNPATDPAEFAALDAMNPVSPFEADMYARRAGSLVNPSMPTISNGAEPGSQSGASVPYDPTLGMPSLDWYKTSGESTHQGPGYLGWKTFNEYGWVATQPGTSVLGRINVSQYRSQDTPPGLVPSVYGATMNAYSEVTGKGYYALPDANGVYSYFTEDPEHPIPSLESLKNSSLAEGISRAPGVVKDSVIELGNIAQDVEFPDLINGPRSHLMQSIYNGTFSLDQTLGSIVQHSIFGIMANLAEQSPTSLREAGTDIGVSTTMLLGPEAALLTGRGLRAGFNTFRATELGQTLDNINVGVKWADMAPGGPAGSTTLGGGFFVPKLPTLTFTWSDAGYLAHGLDSFEPGFVSTGSASISQIDKDLSPFVTRYDPAFPGRPDPQFSIDSMGFQNPKDYNAAGYPRDSGEFWRIWSDQNPKSLSDNNLFRIQNLGLSPEVDLTWINTFPEHANYLGDVLVHHHVDFGQFTVPVPGSTHPGSGGTWHL